MQKTSRQVPCMSPDNPATALGCFNSFRTYFCFRFPIFYAVFYFASPKHLVLLPKGPSLKGAWGKFPHLLHVLHPSASMLSFLWSCHMSFTTCQHCMTHTQILHLHLPHTVPHPAMYYWAWPEVLYRSALFVVTLLTVSENNRKLKIINKYSRLLTFIAQMYLSRVVLRFPVI